MSDPSSKPLERTERLDIQPRFAAHWEREIVAVGVAYFKHLGLSHGMGCRENRDVVSVQAMPIRFELRALYPPHRRDEVLRFLPDCRWYDRVPGLPTVTTSPHRKGDDAGHGQRFSKRRSRRQSQTVCRTLSPPAMPSLPQWAAGQGLLRRYRALAPLVLVATAAAIVPALAGDGIVTDLRLGILAHNVPILGDQKEHGVDVNAEAQFQSFVPESALTGIAPDRRWLLRPAPHIGVDANTGGFTSQLYFGLTWTVNLDNDGVLWPDHTVFLAFGFGPAFNNGHIQAPNTTSHLSLGSNALFHGSLELGYRITARWSLSVYFEHSSNAGLARYNAGLDNLGIRVGSHF